MSLLKRISIPWHRGVPETEQAQEQDIEQDQKMQNTMIQIRDKAFFACRPDPDRAAETVIIAFQLSLARAENGIAPMAEKLDDEPEDQHAQ